MRIDPATLAVQFKVIGREEWVESERQRSEGQGSEGDEEALSPKEARERRQRQREKEQTTLKAAGICGSGIIEAIAELFKAGLVDASGRFVAEAPTDRLCFDASNGSSRPGKAYFVLARPHETSTGREIVVHTDDVRAIQLAKAALYAGAKLLMRHAAAAGLQQVDRIVLAGAFGSYIDPLHAMILGLIPDCDLEHVFAVGNAAGDGALIMLLDRDKRLEAAELADTIRHVQTATDPYFQDEFVNAISLPHASDPYPHLAAVLADAEASRVVKSFSGLNNSDLTDSERAARRSERREMRQVKVAS